MALSRNQLYQPLSLLSQFQNDINQLLERNYAENQDADSSKVVTSQWVPAVDIQEKEDRFILKADLPGIPAEDIDITMDNGVLTLKGERTDENEEEREGYHRIERVRGSFYRRFSLPDTADASRIEAKGKNGVLEIVIPKQEKAQPKKIEVKS
jgi:HSP20 family protein